MTENLAEMVKGHKEKEKKQDLDIPEESKNKKEKTERKQSSEVKITNLSEWFSTNHTNFNNIHHVKVKITGVDPKKTLIFSADTEESTKDSVERRLQIVEDADKIPVLNLPGEVFEVYNNGGFRIIYKEHDGKIIKSYGVKTGMYISHCININGLTIPFKVEKIKKKNKNSINPILIDKKHIEEKMKEDIDIENIELQYNQIQKYKEGMKIKKDVISWMLERQKSITDINHHLKLDELIIQMLT